MENNKTIFLKTDNNTIINEQAIIWVKKMYDCLEVCAKSSGCSLRGGDTHTICRFNNYDSYNRLNKHFE